MKQNYRPIIGITIGDPSGIGPEIILRALKTKEIYEHCRPFVIGSVKVLQRAAKDALGGEEYTYGTINVVETGDYDCDSLEWGKEQKLAGQIAMDAINKSIEMGMAGELDAVTTAPINKVAIKMAGVKQAGHTEIYLDGTHADYVLTMFDCIGMRVFHLSRHMSLKNAIDYATKEHILADVIRIDGQLRKLGIANPEIAVAGINPHCGEGGLF